MPDKEIVSRADFPNVDYKFQISKDEDKYYIYNFTLTSKVEISSEVYMSIRAKMKDAVNAFNNDDYIKSSGLTRELMVYWKQYFPG